MMATKLRGWRFLFRGDMWIWGVVFVLAAISVVEVYSATGALAYRTAGGNTTHFLFVQVVTLGLGIGLLFLFQMIPTRVYYSWPNLPLWIGIALLVYTLLHGVEVNQAKRWIEVMGISIQPSEVVKIPLILFLSARLARDQKVLGDFRRGVLPLICYLALVCGLVLKESATSAVFIAAIGFIMLIIGNVRKRHLVLLAGAGVVSLALLLLVVAPRIGIFQRGSTWSTRLETFTEGESYQARQAKIAIAGGLIWGKGPGNSTQRWALPEAHSDFIYAYTIEEFGLLMGVLVMGAYLVLLWRVRLIVLKCHDNPYRAYLCSGLAVMIGLQAFAHMFISVGLFPVTGLPLPFVSKGGTSILMTGIALGMVQSVARQQKKEQLYEGETVTR